MTFCTKCCGKKETSELEEEKPLIPTRFMQCFLLFMGMAIAYAQRTNLTIAIVAMTDHNATHEYAAIYNWNEKVKSYLLSSFSWGYIITQIPGGYFAQKFGSKLPIFIGLLTCSILCLITPICAAIGDWYLVFGLRALQGLFQGPLFPSGHLFLAKWSPIDERGRLVGFVYSGVNIGTVLTLATGGYIAASPLTWSSIYYITGLAGIIWSAFWFIFSASSPIEHKTIAASEKQYILQGNEQKNDAGPPLKPPWSKILTSVPFYAALIGLTCNSYGFNFILFEISIYINSILGFNIRSNGPLSALPYLCWVIMVFVLIFITGIITRHKLMSVNFSRKFFNTLGQWCPMLALCVIGYVTTGENRNWAIALLVFAVSSNAAFVFGVFANPIDLSPNFAGSLMGILNFFPNAMAITTPLLVGAIVTDEKNPALWRIAFYIGAGFYFVGSMVFIIFGRTNAQPWNYPDSQ